MSWNAVPLGEFASSVDYGVTASAVQEAVGPKFLRITDIQDGSVNWESVPWCRCDDRSAREARLASGDIVFARTGATTGKSFLIRGCPDATVFASYLIRVRVCDAADPLYLSHFFQTPNYWAQISKSARGVAQPGVNATTLKELKVPLPPLSEQRRIAEVLDRAEALRAKRRAALAHLDTLTQSIFFDLFGDPVADAARWPAHSLSALADFENGDRSSNYPSGDDLVSSGVLFLNTRNIIDNRLDLAAANFITAEKFSSLSRGKARLNDLLITLRGTLGACCVFDADAPYAFINAQMMIIRPKETVRPRFLHSVLTTAPMRAHLLRIGTGLAVPQLTATQLAKLVIPVPPLALQLSFEHRLNAIDALKSAHRASLAKLDELFASLQHRAFRGEL